MNMTYSSNKLIFTNNLQSWSDDRVLKVMDELYISLENNAIIRFGGNAYYGAEDDYMLYFSMNRDELIEYLMTVVKNSCMEI